MRRVLAWTAALLLVALVVDQGARLVLERQVAARISAAAMVPTEIAVRGWPVLPRLAFGGLSAAVTTEVPFATLAARLDQPVVWSAEDGLLVAEPADGGPSLALEVSAEGGSLVLTPLVVRLGGLQVPVAALGEGASGRLGDLLAVRRLDPGDLPGMAPDARVTAATVSPTGLVVTVVVPLDDV